jgi:chemotaxis signal transduction protein
MTMFVPDGGLERAREQVHALTQAQARALMDERARRLAKVRTQLGEESETLELLVCRVRDERYAIEIATLEAVHTAQGLVPVPCTPPFVAGILNVRGEIVTVLHLAELLGLRDTPPSISANANGSSTKVTPRQVLLLEVQRESTGSDASPAGSGTGRERSHAGSRIGTADTGAGTSTVRLGLLIDEVVTIERVAVTALTPALSGQEHARGVATLNGSATVVLRVDRLFAGDRFVVMEEPS